MGELQLKLKELESGSLYQLKDLYHENYDLLVLFYSPDDYHQYVGLVKPHPESGLASGYECHIGNFYTDPKKEFTFVDNYSNAFVITNITFQELYFKYKKLKHVIYSNNNKVMSSDF
jgi:hypothetical protein